MLEIIKEVAEKYDLESDWLNDDFATYLTPTMTPKLYMELSNLKIYNFDDKSMLALKLTAARAGRLSNDTPDSIRLMKNLNIESIEEVYEILKKHAESELPSKYGITPEVFDFTETVYEKYIEE